MIIFYIVLVILLVFLLYVILHTRKTNRMLKDTFKNNSVIVFGRKGKGKDLLFQKVIIMRKKRPYMSNISYGYNYIYKDIDVLSCFPNTYNNFIDGDITKIARNDEYEGVDYFLSDGGVYLPCQYDNALNRKYPSFSVYYALSRHLYNQNIHINTQALSRLWKVAREQADYYIKCRRVINLPFIMICFITTYEKYSSAENELLPIGARLFNSFSKAEVDQFNATNGKIENRFYIIKKHDIKYNTRHFKDVLF